MTLQLKVNPELTDDEKQTVLEYYGIRPTLPVWLVEKQGHRWIVQFEWGSKPNPATLRRAGWIVKPVYPEIVVSPP